MESLDLEQALRNARETIEAFVLVGGTLLRDNYRVLTDCAARGVKMSFLFPSLRSAWLREYLAAAGIAADEYVERIRANAALARRLGPGVSVRYHCRPVTAWFSLCDRAVVATKPVALFSQAPLKLTKSAPAVLRFARLFDSVWEQSLDEAAVAPLMCFLSYDRANAASAVALKAALTSRGIAAWRDVDDIPPGANWDLEIQAAISRSTHVLFLVTAESVQSTNVADELSFAREKGKTIIPLMYEEVELPMRVHRAQAIDFAADSAAALRILLGSLLVSVGFVAEEST